MLNETTSQTAGPYLHIGMMPRPRASTCPGRKGWNVLAKPEAQGQRIRLEGLIFDGTDTLVRDALVEIWQANAHGRYDHPDDQQDKPLDPAFKGFGRAVADFKTGMWWFDTDQARPRRRAGTARSWPRTSTSRSSPAASTSTSTRGSTSPTRRRPMPRTRYCG